jgi:hypothetical protein
MSYNTKVTGSILYYARAVDPTVLMPLNDIAMEQTKVTEKTQATTNKMLDYLATHPDATIRYHASDMILHTHSDASYMLVSNARSRIGGLFFFGNTPPDQDKLNGSIFNVASVIKTWSPPQRKQKLDRVFTTPKVELRSKSHSLNWATYDPRGLYEQISPRHSEY